MISYEVWIVNFIYHVLFVDLYRYSRNSRYHVNKFKRDCSCVTAKRQKRSNE